ncbi:MAG: glycosyltransferase [Alphaproteobacteria bacterium]|nr:glycosyltransferase [Alphaproteobacteria bacterium]MCY4231982.1 glycosyltransferase [Alphaproteobacteria bacterium]MCY4319116.1 glycosyltransferase [Alphaproteobacteria bacterium]
MRRGTVVVMLREAKCGAVKTRLAAAIGPARATAFYRRVAAEQLRRLAADRRWQVMLAVTPDGARSPWPRRLSRFGQGHGDLGQRMDRALARAPMPTLLVGSDIPSLRPRHIARAFRRLCAARAVFGPAEDGGFWLVGARQRMRLFAGPVRWSHPQTLADALAQLPFPAALADRLADIDDGAAWNTYTRRPCVTRSLP